MVNTKSINQIIRYFVISVAAYVFVLTSLWFLIDVLSFHKVTAYVLTYIIAYIAEYTSTLMLVFKGRHELRKLIKYVLYVLLFLGISTFIYGSIVQIGLHYTLAALLTAAVLMPIRFLANKYWVYA